MRTAGGGGPATPVEVMVSPLGSAVPFRGLVSSFFVTVTLLAVLWALQVYNVATDDSLLPHGISPRDKAELPDILTAPFLHFGFGHLISNTVPVAVLGFLCATRGVSRFVGLTLVIVVVGGLGVWLTSPANSVTAGASILVFGYFGYLLVRGFLDRKLLDILIAFVVTGVYGWSMLMGVLPTADHVSWQGHLFGFVGGVAAAYVFRRRRDKPREADGGSRTVGAHRTTAAGPRPLSDELKDLGLL
ncbi:rhomboid family intramembrane serine protease [Streptodolium elevatio]|uniref:Rhomboid family intramembrane serine protease n=1 Tax=Streptodolium elevatio TaxID=3157996 RepID=A0ABV3DCE5_9ACTN